MRGLHAFGASSASMACRETAGPVASSEPADRLCPASELAVDQAHHPVPCRQSPRDRSAGPRAGSACDPTCRGTAVAKLNEDRKMATVLFVMANPFCKEWDG